MRLRDRLKLKKELNARRRGFIILLVLIVVLLIPTFFTFHQVRKVNDLRVNGIKAIGIIDSAYIVSSAEIEESFYSGEFITTADSLKVKFSNSNSKNPKNLKKGNKVSIIYENVNPNNYIIDVPSETSYYFFYLLVFVFFILICLIALIYQLRKIKTILRIMKMEQTHSDYLDKKIILD